MNRPQVTAIVVSYRTGPRLSECLYALRTDPDVAHTILVDNGNPAEMTAWLDRFVADREDITLLRPGENLGFGRAVNLAAQDRRGDLLVINPDAVLRRGSVAPLQETARSGVNPRIVGGRIFNLRGAEERGARRKELTLWRAITNALGWNTWTLEHTPPPDGPVSMPVISGAFFLIPSTDFAALGGFDEAYFLHVEDIDLCRRCSLAGGQVMYDPRAGALHYGATSDASSKVVARHKADSLARYFKTYARGPFERAAVHIFMPLMRLAILSRAR